MKRVIGGAVATVALSGCVVPFPQPSPTVTVTATPGLAAPSSAPESTVARPPKQWTEPERTLIREWGMDPESADAEQLITSARSVCETTRGISADALAAALTGVEFEKQKQSVRIMTVLCPHPDIGSALAVAHMSFVEGQWTVGNGENMTIRLGKYKTLPGVQKCYWERKDTAGKIIDNSLVANAPGGVKVTIKAGDAEFTSERCGGYWLRVPD